MSANLALKLAAQAEHIARIERELDEARADAERWKAKATSPAPSSERDEEAPLPTEVKDLQLRIREAEAKAELWKHLAHHGWEAAKGALDREWALRGGTFE